MALCRSLPFIPPIARTPSPVGFVTNENSARDFGKDVTVIKVRNLNLLIVYFEPQSACSSNKIRKAKNEHLNIVCNCEFDGNFLTF